MIEFTLDELISIQELQPIDSAKSKLEQMISEKNEEIRIKPWMGIWNTLVSFRSVPGYLEYNNENIVNEFPLEPYVLNFDMFNKFVETYPGKYFIFYDWDEAGDLFLFLIGDNGYVLSRRGTFVKIDCNDIEAGFISWRRWSEFE